MTPSPQQQGVFDFAETNTGNAIIIAVAGGGKTTTLIETCKRLKGSIAFAAFNKKIAAEIEAKISRIGNRNITVGTFHKFGFSAWRKVAPKVRVDAGGKWVRIVDAVKIPDQYCGFARSAVSLAKQRAIGVDSSVIDLAPWMDMVDHFQLEDKLFEAADENDDVSLDKALEYSRLALAFSNQIATEVIDFDDMLYMPLVANAKIWTYDNVLVDEAQDTNPSRRIFTHRMLNSFSGRAFFVGDPHQAIYGFTGADNDSLDIIKREFNCTELPLTVTYRCPKKVVEKAQQWVQHIEAHPSAPDGVTKHMDEDEFYKPENLSTLQYNDAVLCRVTKPLVQIAFSLIRKGIPCHVEGKDIGRGLIALTRKWKVRTIEALRNRLESYLEREVEKLKKQGKEAMAESLCDKVETVLVIADTLPGHASIEDLTRKIEGMFSDTEEGKPSRNLTLSTVHKSKGLEWPRVFIWGGNKYMPGKWARLPWEQEQEINLIYVALTRSMGELIEVSVK